MKEIKMKTLQLTRSISLATALVLVPSFAGCGGEDVQAPSYIVRVRSTNVVVDAVDDLVITITPADPADHFAPQSGEQLFEDGQVRTTVAGRDFVITYAGVWVRSHLRTSSDASARIRSRLSPSTQPATPTRRHAATRRCARPMRRGGQPIGDGATVLNWPLQRRRRAAQRAGAVHAQAATPSA
jgi:hypothetical protein